MRRFLSVLLCLLLGAGLGACGEKHENVGAYQWADYEIYSLPQAQEEHKFQSLYLDVVVEDTAGGGPLTGLMVKDKEGRQWNMTLAVSPRSTFEGAADLVGQKARFFFTYGGISALHNMPNGMLVADSDRIVLENGKEYRPVFYDLEEEGASGSQRFAISVAVEFDEENRLQFCLPLDRSEAGFIACFFDDKNPVAAYSRMLSAVSIMQDHVEDINVAISCGEKAGAYCYEGESITVLSPIEAFDETIELDDGIARDALQAILAQLISYLELDPGK